MSQPDLVYVVHMLERPFGKTQGLSRAQYDADENLRLALIHLIQTIGEAARRVSPEFCKSQADVRWADIIGMRHKVVHDYLGVDEDIVCRSPQTTCRNSFFCSRHSFPQRPHRSQTRRASSRRMPEARQVSSNLQPF
jgi:uncharacterized protein with HEPN domain